MLSKLELYSPGRESEIGHLVILKLALMTAVKL